MRAMMKTMIVCGAAILLAMVARVSAQSARIFHGEVSDSQCALNVHSLTRSHQEMLKSKSMGGTANTCAVYCIEHLGGYLVLSAGKNVYRLDRSDLVHGFEGPFPETQRVQYIERAFILTLRSGVSVSPRPLRCGMFVTCGAVRSFAR